MTENMKAFFDDLHDALKKHAMLFWIHTDEEGFYDIVFKSNDINNSLFILKLNPYSTFDSKSIKEAKTKAIHLHKREAFIN